MKLKLTPILMLSACAIVTGAFFSTNRVNAETVDDRAWVNRCINDNKGGASAEVILKYCTCMNEAMDENETRSITAFEKANPKIRAKCDRESGWK